MDKKSTPFPLLKIMTAPSLLDAPVEVRYQWKFYLVRNLAECPGVPDPQEDRDLAYQITMVAVYACGLGFLSRGEYDAFWNGDEPGKSEYLPWKFTL